MHTKKTLLTMSAAVLITGCATTHTPAVTAEPVVTASPTGSPIPTAVPRLIPATRADKTVCRRFLDIRSTRTSADRFMAWATFGAGRETANHAAPKLIKYAVDWYDDTYLWFGHRARAGTDYGWVTQICASIGASAP